jgi:GDP-L-fucose synthase
VSFWDGKKVLVTGGAGFIGSHVVERLLRGHRGVRVTVAGRMSKQGKRNLSEVLRHPGLRLIKGDLRDPRFCRRACKSQDVVLNLAGVVGGVGYNSVHHGGLFRDNMTLQLGVLEAARLEGVERFLVVSTACVYARESAIPTPESEGFRGEPEPTNRGYGWAKRMGEYAGRAYAEEFGMKIAIARPYNAYGPRDHFEPDKSHVIAALIRRVCSGEDPMKVWGDGKATRAFLYVDDFVRGLLDTAEKYPNADPVNIGSAEETSIKDLAKAVLHAAGADKTKLVFDPSKPTGQPRRASDTAKASRVLGFQAEIGLQEGLARTIAWYRENLQ